MLRSATSTPSRRPEGLPGDTPIRRGLPVLGYENLGAFALLTDLLSVAGSPWIATAIYDEATGLHHGLGEYAYIGVTHAAVFMSLARARHLYGPKELLAGSHLKKTFHTCLLSSLILIALLFASRQSDLLPRGFAATMLIATFVLVLASRACVAGYLRIALANGWVRKVNVILVGNREPIRQADRVLRPIGFDVVHKVEISGGTPNTYVADIVRHARGSDIHEIHITVDVSQTQVVNDLAEGLRVLPVTVRWIPTREFAEFLIQPVSQLDSKPSFKLQRPPLSDMERSGKRTFDLLFAGSALVVLAPFLVLVAVLIKVDSQGPALFVQRRRGFNGRPFRIFKFRTMTTMDDGATIRQATRGDLRVTTVGRWLRRTSIDELPQLLNVLRGEMSLVGPRPHAVAHDDEYELKISRYAHRHHVKPGITGWAQVNGARGETSSVASMERRVDLDIWYISHWTFLLDIWIVMRTASSMLVNKSAY